MNKSSIIMYTTEDGLTKMKLPLMKILYGFL